MNDNIVGWFSTEDGTHIPLRNGQTKKQAIEEKFKISKDMYDEWSNAASTEMQALIDVGKGKIGHFDYTKKLQEFEDVDGKLNKIASENYSKDFNFNDTTLKASSETLADGSTVIIAGHHGTGEKAGKGGVSVNIKKGFKENLKNFDDYESAYDYANSIIKEVGKAQMTQHTYEIETTEGIDYLILEDGDNIEEVFERYKNDETGEYLKKQMQSFYHIN